MSIYKKVGLAVIALVASLTVTAAYAQDKTAAINAFNAALEVAKGNDIPAAIAAFQKAADIASKVSDAADIKEKAEAQIPTLQFTHAATLYRSNKLAESIDAFKKAAEFGKKYGDNETQRKAENNLPSLYYALGTTHLRSDKFDEANAAFDSALALNPKHATSLYGKYLVLKGQNKWNEAVEAAKKAVEVAQSNNDTKTVETINGNVRQEYTFRAVRSAEARNFSEAVNQLNEALKYGEDADVHYRFAETYNKMGQPDNAIASANKALGLEKGGRPEKAKIHFEIGTAQMAKGNFSAACSAFSEAAVGSFKIAAEHHMTHDLKCSGS